MTTLTRCEIHAIMRLVADSRDNSDALRNNPDNIYRNLHNLECENMQHIYATLENALLNDAKRIAVK